MKINDVEEKSKNTYLHESAYYNFPTLSAKLIENDADIDAQDKNGYTPIMISLLSHSSSSLAVLQNNIGNTELADFEGKTILCHAVDQGNEKLVNKLIEHNCNLDHQTEYESDTALMIAAKNNDSHMMSILLKAGADPNIKNEEGETAEEIIKEKQSELDKNYYVSASYSSADKMNETFNILTDAKNSAPDQKVVTILKQVGNPVIDSGLLAPEWKLEFFFKYGLSIRFQLESQVESGEIKGFINWLESTEATEVEAHKGYVPGD